jgi:hypothetical protein
MNLRSRFISCICLKGIKIYPEEYTSGEGTKIGAM